LIFKDAKAYHLTVEAYYRIFIPDLLKQYEKIVYLDCDLVLFKDVAELYSIDLKGNPLGAVYCGPSSFLPEPGEKDLSKWRMFNSGVLLIDVRSYKEHRIMEKSIELIETGEEFAVCDQDVLNKVLLGKVTYLDYKWNVPWHFLREDFPPLEGVKKEAFEQVLTDPYIVHFTSNIKPWNKPDELLAECFWQYARKTIFYEEIIYREMKTSK